MVKRTVTGLVPAKDGNPQIGPASIEVEYGETGEESISMFGDEAVNTNCFANWRVTLQSAIRTALKAGKSKEQIQADLGSSKLGVARVGGGKIDVEAAFKAKFMTSTPEERKKMIAQLRELAQG